MYKTLKLELINEYILLVSLDRPSACNALNSQMVMELRDIWINIESKYEGVRAVILTGVGEKAFCAGADLKERLNIDVKTWKKQHRVLTKCFQAMYACQIPIITAVNGVAFGGGLELILASDFAYSVSNAKFALPEVSLGIMPGAMGTQLLPRACGIKRANEICLTGKTFSSEDALRWGIINEIFPVGKLMPKTLTVAQKIADNSPLSIRQAKKALRMSQNSNVYSGYLFEIESYTQLVGTEDSKEGVRAFNEKRKAMFVNK